MTIANSDAINMRVQVSLQQTDCISFGYIYLPSSAIAGSDGNFIFNFCRISVLFSMMAWSHPYVKARKVDLIDVENVMVVTRGCGKLEVWRGAG